MKRLLILAVALTIGANCGRPNAGEQKATATVASADQDVKSSSTPLATQVDAKAKKDVAPEFSQIDFGNRSYPISRKHRNILLKDGRAEFFEDKYLGNGWFVLDDVDYADVTGDGNKEAIASLTWVSCGASCDGGSGLFYFFSLKKGKLALLSRIETGSLAEGECGLKSFILRGGRLELDVFRVCRFDGVSLKPIVDRHPNPEAVFGKFVADKFTHFDLKFEGGRFVEKRRRIMANPNVDILNYQSKIEIGND
jgi:hypothetical protein